MSNISVPRRLFFEPHWTRFRGSFHQRHALKLRKHQGLLFQCQGDDFLSLILPDFVGVFIKDMHFNYENAKDFFNLSRKGKDDQKDLKGDHKDIKDDLIM